jgi:hypothetical protein
VVDLSVAVARAQVPENEVAGVKRGQAVAFASEAAGDEPVRGRVVMVNEAVDPARRTVEVWCELPNGEGRLRDGVFGHVVIVTGRPARRVLVPRAAVMGAEGSAAATVMIIEGGSVAHKREVKLRGEAADRVAVEGVKEGEVVVVEGGYGLPDGATVKVAAAEQAEKDPGADQ